MSGAEEETGCPLVTINAKGLEGGTVNDILSVCVYVCFYVVTCVLMSSLSPFLTTHTTQVQ